MIATITTNVTNTELAVNSKRQALVITGSLGGGTLNVLFKSGSTYVPYDELTGITTLTAGGELIVPDEILAFTLTGATTPSITVKSVPLHCCK